MHRAHSKEHGNGHLVRMGTVGEHHDVHACAYGIDYLTTQMLERAFERSRRIGTAVDRTKRASGEAGAVDGADAAEAVLGE